MSSHGGRTGGDCMHESCALDSDGGNAPLATMLKSHLILGNATVPIKFNPPLLRNVSTSVIQSSWIQRLKPISQSDTFKEELAEPSTKEHLVCTHFTRDFRSCSRHLNKTSQHKRSLSWPPHALHLQGVVEHSLMELGKAAYVTKGCGKTVLNTLDLDCQSIPVFLKNITHSSGAGSGTGNLFAQQQSPCALNRENSTLKKLNDLQVNESGGDSKLEDGLAQKMKDVKKVNSVEECNATLQMKALVQTEEAGKNWDYYYGSCGASKDDMCASVLSFSACRAAHGVSADADGKIFCAKSLNCCMGNETLPLQTSFVKPDCEVAFPMAVGSENRVSVDKAGGDWWNFGREAAQTGLIIGSKDVGNLEFLQTVSNFKQLEESVAEPYLIINLSHVKDSGKFHLSPKNSYLSKSFSNANERVGMTTCVVGSRTAAAFGFSKKDNLIKRLDAFYARENSLADLQNPHYSEGGTIRSTLSVGSLEEDAARSRIRDISLGEYWNSWIRLLEEPANEKPPKAGSPTASLQRDYVTENHHIILFQPPLSKGSHDAGPTLDFKEYWSCSPQKHTKTGWVKDSHSSADWTSHCSYEGVREFQKHDCCSHRGTVGRVDAQLHNEDFGLHRSFLSDSSSHSRMQSTHPSQEFFDIERMGEQSSMQQVWMRRWHSSAKFPAMAGKATSHIPRFSRRLCSDELVKSSSGSVGFPLISSNKLTGSFEHNLTYSGRGSDRCTEASGKCIDSVSASITPCSLLARRNFAAFRTSYIGSSVEGMALVCESARKLSPTSLQSRVFCGLPRISPKFVKCKLLPEDEKMHTPESDDSKASECCIGDS